MDERTQRLLSLETVLREWSSRLLSLESMAEGRSNDLHNLRNVVQHESATRIQHIDQVNNALEDVRKTGESMLSSIAILGSGLEELYYEQLFKRRHCVLEEASHIGRGKCADDR